MKQNTTEQNTENGMERQTRKPLLTLHPDNPLVLAPMAGVTDRPFRTLAKRYGAGIVCMEMISANAIKYGNKKTEELISIDRNEHPVSLQIFGPDPETMALAAEHVSRKYDFDILDINMGCPMPKIVNNGEGSALMKDPDMAGKIVEAVVQATDRPVMVKMRAGFEPGSCTAPALAKICEQAGAAAIGIHGRTREQYYTGKADWEVIRLVKEAVKIPVMGNGDVDSPEKAAQMMRETGCDYVMIGRASRGKPWIFSECLAYLEKEGLARGSGAVTVSPEYRMNGEGQEVSAAFISRMILEHARMQIEEKGESMGMLQMRKHITWYAQGQRNAAFLRRGANEVSSYTQLEILVSEWNKGLTET